MATVADSPIRSVAKALSWRFFATAITAAVVFVVTGKLILAAGIGIADALLKLATYYVHERLWERTSFGRSQCPLQRDCSSLEKQYVVSAEEVMAK